MVKRYKADNWWYYCCSVALSRLTLCDPMNCSTLGFPVLQYLPEFARIHVHWVGDAIQPSHPLSSPSLLPSIFLSIKVFSKELVLCIRWPKYWNFNISPSNGIQGWFYLGLTGLISLLSKGLSRVFFNTTVQKHQLFGTQLSLDSNSHPNMTTGKIIALTRQTFVGKVMSLLFHMLSRLIIAFLPRSKHHLISWLQSPSAVMLESKK